MRAARRLQRARARSPRRRADARRGVRARVRGRRVLRRGASCAAAGKDRRHGTGRLRRLMRVIDLDTGDTLQAANDDDLRKAVAGFYADRNEPMSEDDVAQLIDRRAYDATDS